MPTSCVEHFNDDREWGAGKRLLSILKEKGIKNKLLVVTRWFGGAYLGSKRFQLITKAAAAVLTK